MIIFKVLIDALVGLLFAIDNVIYGFIPILYRLLLYLSNVDLVTGNVPVQALIQRVYILVGVFMLFRLSFSILNYIINPDAFSDQSKGFSNLVKRVLIAIVLLVGIPWIFKEGYVIQNKIITSGVLPRLILGESIEYSENAGNEELEDAIETSAKDVQFMLFGPFFSINYEEKGDGEDTGELEVCRPTSEYPTSNILGTNGMAANEACMEKIAKLMDESPEVQSSGAYLSDFFRYEETSGEIVDKRRFDNFGGLLPLTLENGNRVIKYYFIASTLCGGYLVFLLLSFCIDVAARVIRLFFLQILSPIAVISSVDPTSSGDRLKDWAKECVKVWASLFLRLLVIFLIIQLVRVISNSVYSGSIFSTGYSNSSALNAWIYVFLILGVFQAAKSIPDFIEKATGIKMSGDLQLNPFKALKENAGVSLGLAGLGIGATAVASGAVNTLAGIVEGKGVIGTARSALGGFFGGGYRSLRGAMNGEKGMKNFSNSFGSAMFARQQRDDLNAQGSTWQGRLMADVNRHLGLMNAGQRQEMEYSRAHDAIEREKRNLARVKEEHTRDFKDYSSAMSSINDIIGNETKVKNAQARYDEAVRTGVGEAAAKAALDNEKRRVWNQLRYGVGEYGQSNHALVQSYLDRINELRRNNTTIGAYSSITDGNGNFDKSSMYSAQNEVTRIEYEYANMFERQIADRETDIEAMKTTDEWRANELDNSSRAVKSPQPEGWKPSGEISGAYGPQYGPGVWGHRGGNNGRGRP